MRTYYLASLAVFCVFLALFGLFVALDIPVLSDPSYLMEKGGAAAALTGTGLLASDIVLPVPGSLVMVAHGALFGLWLGGLLNLVGGLISSWLGFVLGRKSSRLVARIASEAEQARAQQLLNRYGIFAVIVSRPVPLISETVSIMAGTSNIPMYKLMLAAVAGLLPAGVLYAWIGVYALEIDAGIWSTVGVVIVAGLVWVIGRMLSRSPRMANG